MRWLAWGAFGLFVLIMALGLIGGLKRESSAARPRIDGDALYHEILARNVAKDLVQRQLRDPGSVEWGDVAVRRAGALEAVCGRVNARNALGGYAGMTRFVAFPGLDAASLDDGSEEFADGWRKYCG